MFRSRRRKSRCWEYWLAAYDCQSQRRGSLLRQGCQPDGNGCFAALVCQGRVQEYRSEFGQKTPDGQALRELTASTIFVCSFWIADFTLSKVARSVLIALATSLDWCVSRDFNTLWIRLRRSLYSIKLSNSSAVIVLIWSYCSVVESERLEYAFMKSRFALYFVNIALAVDVSDTIWDTVRLFYQVLWGCWATLRGKAAAAACKESMLHSVSATDVSAQVRQVSEWITNHP